MKVIIYKQDSGFIAVVNPAAEIVERYGIERVAEVVVPFGKRFAIIDRSILPEDNEFFDAWTVDDADLSDGVGGKEESF